MAATGLLATVLWFGGAGILGFAGIANATMGFLFVAGLFFLPISLLTSFIVGTLLWRKLPRKTDRQRYGAIFGGATALSSLAVGAFGPALILSISNVARGEMPLTEAFVFSVLLLPVSILFAVIAAGWLVVPLGAFGGWYHERAKDLEE